MPDHQITCVTKETVKQPSTHEHIVSVRAGGVTKSVQQVIADSDARLTDGHRGTNRPDFQNYLDTLVNAKQQ